MLSLYQRQLIFSTEYEETKVKPRHQIKNLRFLNPKDTGNNKLSDEGLILWLAITQHDISQSTNQIKFHRNKMCHLEMLVRAIYLSLL